MSDAGRPAASRERLRQRAELLASIRDFFRQRGVLEVDTPVLAAAAASDPQLASFRVVADNGEPAGWLLTSPESGLKQLLAAGSGDVYQLGHVFRCDESGRWHRPEFCMLEWYRIGWDMPRLMTEVETLIRHLSRREIRVNKCSYSALFEGHTGLDPIACPHSSLRDFAQDHGLAPADAGSAESRDYWLDLIISIRIAPTLGVDGPLFVTDFPASQASLTRVNPSQPDLAERFELYWQGIELANGGQEETSAEAVAARVRADNAQRVSLGLTERPIDTALVAALNRGLPDCAGVAMGVDRLLALLLQLDGIDAVMPLSANSGS